jgi:hypothetical protein
MHADKEKTPSFHITVSEKLRPRHKEVDVVTNIVGKKDKKKETRFRSSVAGYSHSDFRQLTMDLQAKLTKYGLVVSIPKAAIVDYRTLLGESKMLDANLKLDLPLHLDMFQYKGVPARKNTHSNAVNREHLVPYLLFITRDGGDAILAVVHVYSTSKTDIKSFPYSLDIMYDSDWLDINSINLSIQATTQNVILPCYYLGEDHGYVTFDAGSDNEFRAIRVSDQNKEGEAIPKPITMTHTLKDPLSVTFHNSILKELEKEYHRIEGEMIQKMIHDIPSLVDVKILQSASVDAAKMGKICPDELKGVAFSMMLFHLDITVQFIPTVTKKSKADIQYIRKVFEIFQHVISHLQHVIQQLSDKLKELDDVKPEKNDSGVKPSLHPFNPPGMIQDGVTGDPSPEVETRYTTGANTEAIDDDR